MMKGIDLSLKLVADVIITLVAVLVVFLIFKTLLPTQTNNAICKIYRGISALPLPEFLKTMPEGCSSIFQVVERIRISENDGSKIEQRLADYIVKCWDEKAGSGKSGTTFDCYEIYIKWIDGTVTEYGVTEKLRLEKYCKTLPNNFLDQDKVDYNCGSENKIYWKNDFEGDDVTIIVKYSAFPIHRIEVI